MLTLFFDERLNILSTFGVPLSAKPTITNNVVNLSVNSRPSIDIDNLQKMYETGFKNYFGYAYSLTFSRDVAADIVQAVFARLVAKVNRDGSISPENIEAYIIRSIRNEHIDRKRKEIRSPSHLSIIADNNLSAEQEHLNTGTNQRLQSAIQKLPTAQRTCLVMYFYNELNTSEIAKELGISISAVKTHIQRAKKNLRKSDMRETEGSFE